MGQQQLRFRYQPLVNVGGRGLAGYLFHHGIEVIHVHGHAVGVVAG